MGNVKKQLKYFMPPILFDKIIEMKGAKYFRKYKRLLEKNSELKNINSGKRCFILGSGPSIKKQDLKPLKDEVVFALNNFYVHPDFKTIMSGAEPKYYITAPTHKPQVEDEWKSWFQDMQKNVSPETTMILGLSGYEYNIKYLFDKYNLFQSNKIYWYFPGVITNEYYNFNPKHIDLTKRIWGARTVSIYALITAIYMGFKEIYLLGMDHDYFLYDNESDMRMYSSAIHQKNEIQRTSGKSFYTRNFLSQYKTFSQYELLRDNSKSSILNASFGGVLRVFERVKFENLFDKEN